MKAVSETVQTLYRCYFFEEGHSSKFLYEWEALFTRNLQAKYEGSIWKG